MSAETSQDICHFLVDIFFLIVLARRHVSFAFLRFVNEGKNSANGNRLAKGNATNTLYKISRKNIEKIFENIDYNKIKSGTLWRIFAAFKFSLR